MESGLIFTRYSPYPFIARNPRLSSVYILRKQLHISYQVAHAPVYTLISLLMLFLRPFQSVSPVSFSTLAVSFQSYCSLLYPAHSYLCTPTLDYLAYRAYANARAYLRNGVGALSRYYISRDAKMLSQKRKKFIRAIKNALRDFIRVRKLPARISKNYVTNRSTFYRLHKILLFSFPSYLYAQLTNVF